MLAVCGREEELAPVEIVVVHFDQVDRLDAYRTHHGVPDHVRLVADPERALYSAFHIGRGSWWRVWGPRTIRAYARLLRRGRRYDRHRGDSLQLGGDVVVDAGGTVRWAFLPEEPDARPSVEQIATALDEARSTSV